MSEPQNKAGTNRFAEVIAKAQAQKAAKKAQSKKDRADEGKHVSSKLAFQARTPIQKQGVHAGRIMSRAKKGP